MKAQDESGQRRPPLFGAREQILGCGVVLLEMIALAVSVLNDAFQAARSATCYAYGNTLSTALSMYAADHDDRLPPANQWADVIRPYTKLDRDIECTTRPTVVGPRAFNLSLDRRLRAKVNDNAPLLFESNAGKRNHADLLESFTRPHKGKGWIVLGGGKVKSYVTPPDARFGQ